MTKIKVTGDEFYYFYLHLELFMFSNIPKNPLAYHRAIAINDFLEKNRKIQFILSLYPIRKKTYIIKLNSIQLESVSHVLSVIGLHEYLKNLEFRLLEEISKNNSLMNNIFHS